jgi:hypothetical protein
VVSDKQLKELNLQLSPLAREKLRGEKPVPPTPVVEL